MSGIIHTSMWLVFRLTKDLNKIMGVEVFTNFEQAVAFAANCGGFVVEGEHFISPVLLKNKRPDHGGQKAEYTLAIDDVDLEE